MDEGQTYQVWYKDEDRVRHKTLRFLKEQHSLLHFFNAHTNKLEILSPNNLIRMEGEMEQCEKDTQTYQYQ